MSAASTALRGEIVWLERRAAVQGFTARDLSELDRWGAQRDRAVVLDDNPVEFAQLYEGNAPWAAWAVSRQHGEVLVWNCVSFADVGRFGCMLDALAAISGVRFSSEAPSNVISLAGAQRQQVCRARAG